MPTKNRNRNRNQNRPAQPAPAAQPTPPSPPTPTAPTSDAFDLPSLQNLRLDDNNKKMSKEVQHAIVHYMKTDDRLAAASVLPDTFGKLDRVVPHRLRFLKFEQNAIVVNAQRVYFVHHFIYVQRQMTLGCTVDVDGQGRPINIRVPANQKLKEGDIVFVRREDDPYKEDLPEPNGIKERPDRIQLMKLMQLINVSPVREMPLPLSPGIKFPDALRSLSNQILDGDRVHVVDRLSIGFREGIIRLPVGVQLKVRKLALTYNAFEALKAIRPIIHPSSWPLEEVLLSVDAPSDPVIRDMPDARSITVCLTQCLGRSNWKIFSLVRRPHIHLAEAEIHVEDWVYIAQSWKHCPPPIGYKFSMNTKDSASDYIDSGKSLGGVIKMLPGKQCGKFPYCASIPLNEESELNFYGAKAPFYEQEMKTVAAAERILWMVVMEVMAKGTAEDAVD